METPALYSTILAFHSWLRWAALLLGVIATLTAFARGSSAQGREAPVDRWGLYFMMCLDLQFLLGLLLYFWLSPFITEAFRDLGAAMHDSALRFWAVEHITIMLAAVVIAHVGRVIGRNARTPAAKRQRLIICFGASTLLMIVGTPWPGRAAGRPLFRALTP